MEDVDFSRVLPNYLGNQVYIEFGASEGNPVAPLFIAGDSKSLQGHHVVVSKHLDGFGLVPGCQGIFRAVHGNLYLNSSSIFSHKVFIIKNICLISDTVLTFVINQFTFLLWIFFAISYYNLVMREQKKMSQC